VLFRSPRNTQSNTMVHSFTSLAVSASVTICTFSFTLAFVPLDARTCTRSIILLHSAPKSTPSFQFSASSLRHLADIELPSDYSRPWTMEKTKALASAFALGSIFGYTGEVAMYNLFEAEKTFPCLEAQELRWVGI